MKEKLFKATGVLLLVLSVLGFALLLFAFLAGGQGAQPEALYAAMRQKLPMMAVVGLVAAWLVLTRLKAGSKRTLLLAGVASALLCFDALFGAIQGLQKGSMAGTPAVWYAVYCGAFCLAGLAALAQAFGVEGQKR